MLNTAAGASNTRVSKSASVYGPAGVLSRVYDPKFFHGRIGSIGTTHGLTQSIQFRYAAIATLCLASSALYRLGAFRFAQPIFPFPLPT